jgi:hypothetical protein
MKLKWANKAMNTDVKILANFYAVYGNRSAVEVSIEKDEKTAMQWLKNRPKTIDNDVKEKYKTSPTQTCGEKGMFI